MINDKNEGFLDIEKKILKNEVLLPDFQRGFKWTDDEKQISIIASVLTRLPIGSILLINSKANEYGAKIIGSKTTLELSKEEDDKKVSFLLDGQQRITVLTNAFSDIVLDLSETYDNLISSKLKRRYFLRIPKWRKCYDNQSDTDYDLFKLGKLEFPFQSEGTDNLTIVTDQIKDFIAIKEIKNNISGREVSSSAKKLTNLLTFYNNDNDKDYYFIPLFTFVRFSKTKTGDIDNAKEYAFTSLFKSLGEEITNEIIDYYNEPNTNKKDLLNSFEIVKNNCDVKDDLFSYLTNNDNDNIRNTINNFVTTWCEGLKNYLQSCVNYMDITLNVLEDKQRDRAICMYTNMNQTSVSLDTFDLLMARVAKYTNSPFIDQISQFLTTQKRDDYPIGILSDALTQSINKTLDQKYNASDFFEVSRESQPKSTFIRNYLRLLYIYSKNPNCNYEDISNKTEYGGTTKVLTLQPQQICENTEQVCKAIDRAFFFFQTRCGLRKIEDIHFDVMLTVVACFFFDDKNFKNKNVHHKLEAWYWISIFSGRYDKDQKKNMLEDIKLLYNSLENADWNWLKTRQSKVFNNEYSNSDFLLLNNVEDNGRPKEMMKDFVCQWFLSQGYSSLFDNNKQISVFENSEHLEAHHIIPLAEGTYKESSIELRKNSNHYLNSPLNFVFITADENKKIGEKSFYDYSHMIQPNKMSQIGIILSSGVRLDSSVETHKTILKDRFNRIKDSVTNEVDQLISFT